MDIRKSYGLDTIINARGTFTPLGVSRSSPMVRAAVSQALGDYLSVDQMQAAASRALSDYCGAEAGTIVHCAAGGITLAIAACMTGSDPAWVARLPDAQGLSRRVILPTGHAVNYGHPIEQAIRLAGALPVLVGFESACASKDMDEALGEGAPAACFSCRRG